MTGLAIDVSHIIGWQGNLTGIERVEFYLIKHYFDHTDASFIAWDEAGLRFRPVSRKEVARRIINRSSEQELHAAVSTPALVQRAARKARRLLGGPRRQRVKPDTLIVLAGMWDKEHYIQALLTMANNTKLVHVIYDMIPLVKSEYVVDWLPSVYGNYIYKVLPRCVQVLAISECSARDTVKALKAKKLHVPRIDTFRLGDDITRAPRSVPPIPAVPEPFVLSVSTVEARKNHKLLMDVCRQAKDATLPTFVIAGRRGWKTESFQQAVDNNPEVKGKIIILDTVSDSQLRWLYEHCLFTIFPSLYEGWGLPVAESLNYGKVTLSSEASSMPEVGGNAADYFKPTDATGLLDLIKKYQDPKKRVAREHYIKDNYKPTLWEDTARQFAERVRVK